MKCRSDTTSSSRCPSDALSQETGNKAVVVEDHFQNGGLGDAVCIALAGEAKIVHLCIKELPRSGTPEELLDKYGISAKYIKRAVKKLVRR